MASLSGAETRTHGFTRSDGLVPIWEVFPAFKDKLKKGFDAYIKKRALNIEKKRIVMAKYTEGSKFATSAGSGARQTLDLYKPSDFTTWKYVGHSGNNNKVLVLKEISDQYGALYVNLLIGYLCGMTGVRKMCGRITAVGCLSVHLDLLPLVLSVDSKCPIRESQLRKKLRV